jgi:hypothetical protein
VSLELIHGYLDAAGHGADENGALFRPIRNNRTGEVEKALDPDMVYKRWCGGIRQSSASRSALMHYARRPPPMRSTTKLISPRSRSGLATSADGHGRPPQRRGVAFEDLCFFLRSNS